MRAVVQRVARASVAVHDQMVSEIGKGVLVLLGLRRAIRTAICSTLWIRCRIYASLRMARAR